MLHAPSMASRLALLGLFAAGLAACGPEPSAVTEAAVTRRPIIGGRACQLGEQPAAVAIIADLQLELSGQIVPLRAVVCTGTLIAPDTVLTAAHCVDLTLLTGDLGSIKQRDLYVSLRADQSALVLDATTLLGGSVAALPPDAVKARGALPHPSFSVDQVKTFTGGLANLHDVGLLFLEREITAVQPAVLITAAEATQLAKGTALSIAGWGQQSAAAYDPYLPPPKGAIGVKRCAASSVNELGAHEMQVGSGPTSARKCHGDSGGPSLMTVTTAHLRTDRLVGITSHAYDATDCAKGGVDTRVDVWLSWIDAALKKACSDGTRSWCTLQGIIPPGYYDTGGGGDGGAGVGTSGSGTIPIPESGCAVAPGAPAQSAGSPLALLLAALVALALSRRRV